MHNFQLLHGPHDVPIFFRALPESLKSVSLHWIVFIGSADDTTFGQPGLFHWFEHVPFRGTRHFPDGNKDTLARFERWAGHVNASTSETRTVYEAHVLKQNWLEALDLLTDLVSHPLLRQEDIEAEREIIYEEITEIFSNQESWAMNEVRQRVWAEHPYQHEICGSIESLKKMDPGVLRQAHASAYDRSRCVMVIAGPLSSQEVLQEVGRRIEQLPHHTLPERHQDQQYGPAPKWEARTEKIKAPFPASGTLLLFPHPPIRGFGREIFKWEMLKALFSFGANAPLTRIVREERQLVYGASMLSELFPEGGYWGFAAKTRKCNIDQVRRAYRDVLKDNQLRSREWFAYVRDHMLAGRDMQVRAPDDYTADAEQQITRLGFTVSEEETDRMLASITYEEVMDLLESIDFGNAREFIFRGKA